MTNKVHFIDNMEFMANLPDNAFDLAPVDPEYGIGDFLHYKKEYKKRKIDWNDTIPSEAYFKQLFRVSKNQFIWGGNYFTKYLPPTNSWVVWDKRMSDPFKSKVSRCEMAWTSFNIAANVIVIPWASGFYRKRIEDIIHECQKPVKLAKWILEHYATPGDKILDTHVGSGYMRIACEDMGFYFEGCENDKEYWQAQEDRYQNYVATNRDLFTTDEYQQLIYE
jgi:site-specific DNA-methyltransferase (adenine-specific)